MRAIIFLLFFVGFVQAFAALPVEPIPHSLTLPAQYPKTWVYVHDLNFNSLVDGRIVVLDVASASHNYKGSIGAGHFASFAIATRKEELYVAETFFSRRTRGQATDTLSIYNRKNLAPIDEIVLPGNKRLKIVTHKHALQLIDHERLALVSNFTPAASVTVVDLAARKVLGEIQTPACNLIYGSGKRGFSTLCSNGTLATFNLNANGSVNSESVSRAFIDIQKDPLFAKTATLSGITYFPSFQGRIQPVDFRAEQPRGQEGSHKKGGSEVWVFDAVKHQRLVRLPLKTWGFSIEVTQSDPSYLVVTNVDMATDVYAAESGEHLRTLKIGTEPYVMYSQR